MQNNLRQSKVILYKLKRLFGLSVTIYQPTLSTHNLETGSIEREYTSVIVRKAIVMTAKSLRTFLYDLTYIAANKNFTYGSYFDIETRIVIFDKKDLQSVTLNMSDHLEFNNKRYEIKALDVSEDGNSVSVIATHLTNSSTVEV